MPISKWIEGVDHSIYVLMLRGVGILQRFLLGCTDGEDFEVRRGVFLHYPYALVIPVVMHRSCPFRHRALVSACRKTEEKISVVGSTSTLASSILWLRFGRALNAQSLPPISHTACHIAENAAHSIASFEVKKYRNGPSKEDMRCGTAAGAGHLHVEFRHKSGWGEKGQ